VHTLLCHCHNPQGDYARLLTGTNGYISTVNLPDPLQTG
jgi:hypothetical protein